MLLSKLVPPQYMYKYNWFAPSDHQDWYYYAPRKNISFDKNSEFIYKTLDNNLKDIFFITSKKGYTTLPSCEGHFHTPQIIKNKYNSIIKDFVKITTGSFLLKEIESNKNYKYFNKNYELPWHSFNHFKNDVEKNMSVGYFGIVNPVGIKPMELKNIIFDIETINNHKLLHIIINNNRPEDIIKNWKVVYNILKNNLL